MPLSTADRDRLRQIKSFPSLVKYLRDELDWPIESGDFIDLDDWTFDYTAEELGIDARTAAKIQDIKQLRPLDSGQPWGIFFVKFEPRRLPVVALRRILGKLVVKKRDSANRADRAAWDKHDLLFISNYGEGEERQITFAHFTDNGHHGDLPTLKVLGWDQEDTALHLDHVQKELHEHLKWPDDPANLEQWRKRWGGAFELKHREVITTSKQLALRLADLARDIRKRANAAIRIETENGPLRSLMKGFQQALIHDLKEDDFADMYAQTISYGLLSARVSRPAGMTANDLSDMVPPQTNPFLKELLESFLNIGGRKWDNRKGKLTGIDFDELGINDVVDTLRAANMEAVLRDFGNRNPTEDPVIHFYELFLKEYDAKKRMQRGVFYTPRPVVSYIVRSVHELLQTEFGLEDGLADTSTWAAMLMKHDGLKLPEIEVVDPKTRKVSKQPIKPGEHFVQILDPACGTGTFLVEVIDVIYNHLRGKWTEEGHGELFVNQKWNQYVPEHLLPRLHGYELMMAPYAIAHMKIGLKLFETGYKFGSGERARIYLTNALEPPQDFSDTFEQMAPALAHEAKAVNDVKRHQRFTVVIGNPPYANFGQLNKNSFVVQLLDEYKRELNEKKLNLDDDFIKFVRYGQHLLVMSGVGMFGMITNSTYLDGLTHRQMRAALRETFGRVSVLDLHGSSKRQEKNPSGGADENVFDIQTGVAISIFHTNGGAASVHHAELWGDRTAKYDQLNSTSAKTTQWRTLEPEAPYWFFRPKDMLSAGEYQLWPGIKSIFDVGGCGIKTERDRVSIHWSLPECQAAVEDFRRQPEPVLREKYDLGTDSRDWKVANAKADVRANRDQSLFRRILYRPFDARHIWYSGQTRGFVGTPGYPTMRHLLGGKNLSLLTCRQQAELGFHHVFCTRMLAECCTVSLKTREITSVFPLYVSGEDGLTQQPIRLPNFSAGFLRTLCVALDLTPQKRSGLPEGLTPEEIFHYTYAVLHSPTYRTRYAEILKIDFPRVPMPKSVELVTNVGRIGEELVALHLLESPNLRKPITTYVGAGDPEVEKVRYGDGTVWLDKKQTCGFAGVPEAVWSFHIGGYQVCHKWLKDRKGRRLSKDDIAHYQKIVVALSETIRLMKEIDETIEKHGGWPGAFVSDPAKLEELNGPKA